MSRAPTIPRALTMSRAPAPPPPMPASPVACTGCSAATWRLGASSVSDVEVIAGVAEGELVVVGSLALLRDGLQVTLEGEDPAAGAELGEA